MGDFQSAVFVALNREGKKHLLDDLCVTFVENADYSSLLLIYSLVKMDMELIDQVYQTLYTVSSYIYSPDKHISDEYRPEALKKIDQIENEVNERFLEIDRSENHIKQEKIDEITSEFILNGSYISYLLLKDIRLNYCSDNWLKDKIEHLVEYSVEARNLYVENVPNLHRR
ncbi:ORF-100 [Teiidae poxvirus 1]|nr:ORF-100 [Teiidae poxvirus 1]